MDDSIQNIETGQELKRAQDKLDQVEKRLKDFKRGTKNKSNSATTVHKSTGPYPNLSEYLTHFK